MALKEIRCYSIISNKKDVRYGEKCNRHLLSINKNGEAAGEIKCARCNTLYDISTDNQGNIKINKIKVRDKK